MPATAAAVMRGHTVQLDASEQAVLDEKKNKPTTDVNVQEVDEEDDAREEAAAANGTDLDVAVNEVLTLRSAARILSSPLTWLPALAYMSTFGFELAVDSNLHHDLLLTHPNLGDLNAGYLASIFGCARPARYLLARCSADSLLS
jgi:NNP family nitrate/nitrite transporter-like MFS transporter